MTQQEFKTRSEKLQQRLSGLEAGGNLSQIVLELFTLEREKDIQAVLGAVGSDELWQARGALQRTENSRDLWIQAVEQKGSNQ